MAIAIAVAAVLIMVILFAFARAGQDPAWDTDPNQQRLALLLIAEAQNSYSVELNNFIVQQPWSAKELRNRVIHALQRVRSTAPPEVYQKTKEIGHRISMESYRYEPYE